VESRESFQREKKLLELSEEGTPSLENGVGRSLSCQHLTRVVTGYGYTSESGPIALKVKAANVLIVDDQQCTARINSVTEKVFLLPASSFCAGGGSSSAPDGLLDDSCQGDGGGPLVCESGTDGEEEVYEVTGLVSWGFGCGRPGIPAVYVKVSSFIGWINQVISVNNQ
jgi:secreted trypsin-like serine protease